MTINKIFGTTELEQLRQQFDHMPYPKIPLDHSPIYRHS